MFYLVRHPQSKGNVKKISSPLDDMLTNRGLWQAEKTVQKLAHFSFDRVISSPALRCMYLAEKIALSRNLILEVNPQIRERDYGTLTGKSGEQIFSLGLDNKPEDGESVYDVYHRAQREANYLQHREGSYILVSHGLFLKMFCANLLNMDTSYAAKTLKFSNCGISCINPPLIEFLNDRSHLGSPINRVHIFGCWGAGKTWLANKLGKIANFPVYSLDDIKYTQGIRKERSLTDRLETLDAITLKNKWVTEGAWTTYAQNAFERADLLIYQDTSEMKAIQRATLRNESRHPLDRLDLEKLRREIRIYHHSNNVVSKFAHDNIFNTYKHKSIKGSQIPNYLQFLEDLWCLT